MSTATIFAYKGNIGIIINENGKFINDPSSPDQLGAVISTSEVEISKEAKDIIRSARREGGSFAELMLTEHVGADPAYGKSSIAVLGPGRFHHLGSDFKIGRTCTISVLDDCKEVPNNPPADYMEFIDSAEE